VALLLPSLHGQIPLPSSRSAQPTASPANQEQNDDPLGRNTPRGSVVGFMRAADKQDYDQAASYLETTQHGEAARQLAQQLQAILDRETSIDLSKLSRKPEGSLTSSSPNRELVGVAKTSSGDVEIFLDRVSRGDNSPIWLFSRSTLQQVPDIYQDIGNPSAIEQHIPGWLKISIFSLPLWRLIIVLIAIPLILLVGTFAVQLITRLISRVESPKLRAIDGSHGKSLVGPLRLILFGVLCRINSGYALTLLSRNFWRYTGNVLLVFGITWMLMRIVAIGSKLGVARLRRNRASDQIALANLVGRLSQIGIFIIGILVVLHLAGVNLTAALTGLGIGGLAIAFAAQKTLENLFGGIMIISDRPVRIGDSCKAGDVNGTVVDIGLRSTRIRTQDRTIVTIPNGQLATMNLENFTLRDKFWFHPTIMLQQQTTNNQMEAVLRGIREMLHDHANVESETVRVRFIGISNTSLDIEVYSYVFAPDYNGFLAIQEALLLQILATVESAGTAPAVPIQISRVMNGSDFKSLSSRNDT
jgi:MscS family membrane protein